MKALFCIVTGQAAANMNAIEKIAPDKVILATTETMKANAQTLATEMRTIGKKTEEFYIEQEHSLLALTGQYEQWLNDNIDKYDEIIVNITGGTKPMSIAAYQVFGGMGFRCFYQNLNPDQLVWLDDESIIPNLGHTIGLDRYLRMYQFQVDYKQTLAKIPKAYKDYANKLFEELCYPQAYPKMLSFIGKINAHTADKKMDLTYFKFDSQEIKLLEKLSEITKIFEIKEGKIICQDLAAQALMNGGWLEVVTANAMQATKYRDISQSVEISKSTKRQNSQTHQEIDVMAMQDNMLVIIECKTKKWQSATEASASIYKLSALGDIGGLNTRPIFVSLHDLPPAAKTRAAEMNIKVIAGQDSIIALKTHLNK